MKISNENIREVFEHYLICALWSTTIGDEDENLDLRHDTDDFDPKTFVALLKELREFIRIANDAGYLDLFKLHCVDGELLPQVGHDFWLTRNGHGAGFWDRGAGDVGDNLTRLCKDFKEVYLYIGDDGKIYKD